MVIWIKKTIMYRKCHFCSFKNFTKEIKAENENEVTCEQNQPKSAIKFNKKHSKFNEIWRGD